MSSEKMTKKETATLAYFSGLIYGWASRIEERTNVELKDDMEAEAKRIGKLAGVKIE